nr:hypothetical protein [Tanacetum cinerariifolium]
MSAKRTSWNEFISAMASAVIFLSTGRKFNFSKYIFDSLVRNVYSSSKFYMYPRFIQLIIQNQIGDLSTHTTKYISPALTQKVFANIRRIGKGFSGVETPLFEGMLVVRDDVVVDIEDVLVDSIPLPALPTLLPQSSQDTPSTSQAQSPPQQPQSLTLAQPQEAQTLDITQLKKRVKKLERVSKVKTFKLRRLKKVGTSQRVETFDDTIMEDVSNQRRMIVELDKDEGVELIVEVVTTAKLITKVINAASTPVSAASTIILAAKQIIPAVELNIPAVTITAAPIKVAAASTRRRRGVVIRDPEEESSAKTSDETKSKDKCKGILVEDPKPMKKNQQVEMDEAYARKLHEELNQDIDWDVAIEHVKKKAKEDPFIQRYQVMKKRPQTEAQARRNMIMYLKNNAGFKLDYFKGKSYDDIRPIFKAKFNTNMEFLLKSKEQIKEEESRALESINETPAQKAAKRRRLNQEDKDVEEIKQHMEIVPDEDDDVYIEATLLARKVPVVDYHIILLELMMPRSLKKNTKCFSAAGEELSAAKNKLMLLVYCY